MLILVSSAFFCYLSWARRVRVAPARVVTDTHTHYEYCNLAPAWARLIMHKIWHVNTYAYNHAWSMATVHNLPEGITSVCSHLITRECIKEHVPRTELTAGVGSCSTHKCSRSVRLKLLKAASAVTCVMRYDNLQATMAILRMLRSLQERCYLQPPGLHGARLVRAYLLHGTLSRSTVFESLLSIGKMAQTNKQTDGRACLLYLPHTTCARGNYYGPGMFVIVMSWMWAGMYKCVLQHYGWY